MATSMLPHPLPPALAELVAERFRLLAEPTRIRLLDALREDELTVGELADQLGTTQQNVSKHLKLLVDGGIVGRERRGVSTVCSIIDPLVFDLCEAACGGLRRQVAQLTQLLDGQDRS